MASEGNKAVAPSDPASSGAKRKRGRPRKYEYSTHEQPQMAQPIQSIPPLRSTLYSSNIRHDGVHINHTSGGTVDSKMHTAYVLPANQTRGDRSTGPRDSGYTVKTHENQASSYSAAHVQGNSGKDVIIGKHFVGKMTKKSPGFSLITVKVKGNQVLRGWIPDNLRPITPKDDLAPDLPMLRPSQVQKKASAIHRQVPPSLPVHLEDVTIAKPLQMRRPVEIPTAQHLIPPTPRPYIGSGVVAAAPVTVKSGNAESRPLPKQDMESASPGPSATPMPVNSAQPLFSCIQMDKQDVPLDGKSVPVVNSDSESSDGTKESSVYLEDVTIAKPLQMRRPVDISTAKHIIPPTPRPYIGSGVVAAAPVSVKPGNAESRPLPKQDTESACPESSATAVPVNYAQPVLISCIQMDKQDVPVEGKSVPEVNSNSESSGQIQPVAPAATDEIEITTGSKKQSNSATSKQHICKEPADNTEQQKTEANSEEVDGSMTGASAYVQSVDEEDEMKVDSK